MSQANLNQEEEEITKVSSSTADILDGPTGEENALEEDKQEINQSSKSLVENILSTSTERLVRETALEKPSNSELPNGYEEEQLEQRIQNELLNLKIDEQEHTPTISSTYLEGTGLETSSSKVLESITDILAKEKESDYQVKPDNGNVASEISPTIEKQPQPITSVPKKIVQSINLYSITRDKYMTLPPSTIIPFTQNNLKIYSRHTGIIVGSQSISISTTTIPLDQQPTTIDGYPDNVYNVEVHTSLMNDAGEKEQEELHALILPTLETFSQSIVHSKNDVVTFEQHLQFQEEDAGILVSKDLRVRTRTLKKMDTIAVVDSVEEVVKEKTDEAVKDEKNKGDWYITCNETEIFLSEGAFYCLARLASHQIIPTSCNLYGINAAGLVRTTFVSNPIQGTENTDFSLTVLENKDFGKNLGRFIGNVTVQGVLCEDGFVDVKIFGGEYWAIGKFDKTDVKEQEIDPLDSPNFNGNIELLSEFQMRKKEISASHSEYVSKHPELYDTMFDFLQLLLHQKPVDVYAFTNDYFSNRTNV